MDKSKYNETVQLWLRTIEENYRKDKELALKYCEDVIAYGKETGDKSLIALGHYHMGVIYYTLNDGAHFQDAIITALSNLSLIEDWELMARCYNFLGISSANHGNAAIGMDYYIAAIDACKVAGADALASTVMVNIAVLDILYERYDDAIQLLEKARDYYQQHPESPRYQDFMICVYENMARAYLYKGDLIEAKCCFENIYLEHGEFLNQQTLVTVWATEAMYYHIAGKDEKCEKLIAKIHHEMADTMPIMDMFDDFYDYFKMLLERDKKEEFWKLVELIEPKVKKLDIPNLMLKMLGLKIEYYREYDMDMEYYQTTALYYEYSLLAMTENKYAMNNVLNLRKTLEVVNKEKDEMFKLNADLQKKSETDALTGLNNRFGLNEYSEAAFHRAAEAGTAFAVEIMDLDNFKAYNDLYGHQKGDECIQQVADAIKSMEEFGAYTARYGGDEFMLIYEDVTKEQMVEYAAELRKRVLDLQIEHSNSKVAKVMTISQGICWDVPIKGNHIWDYLHSADNMLYRVKQRKRNNFCIGNLTESSEQIVMSYL